MPSLGVFLFPRHLLVGVPFAFAMVVVFGTFFGSTLFVVRGYEVEGAELLIPRLLWTIRVSLLDLRAAWADPSRRGS